MRSLHFGEAGRHAVHPCGNWATHSLVVLPAPSNILDALVKGVLMVAQDQLRAMRELVQAAFGDDRPHVDVYDGDSPQVSHAGSLLSSACRFSDDISPKGFADLQRISSTVPRLTDVTPDFFVRAHRVSPSCCLATQSERPEIRDRASLLITNPDMLHCSMLPVHRTFSRLLAHLRFVVVDEGHAYRCAGSSSVPSLSGPNGLRTCVNKSGHASLHALPFPQAVTQLLQQAPDCEMIPAVHLLGQTCCFGTWFSIPPGSSASGMKR